MFILTGPDVEVGGVRHAADVNQRLAQSFASDVARYSGHPEAADRYLRQIESNRSLPASERDKMRVAGPKREFDIGYNITKIHPDAMSDDQRVLIAQAVKMREAVQKLEGDPASRKVPYTHEQLREDMKAVLDYHTPEELVDMAKVAKTIQTPADLALLKTVAVTFSNDVEKYQAQLMAAERDLATARKLGDNVAISDAHLISERTSDLLAQSVLRRDHAIFTLLPHTTRVARMLQALNQTFAPLSAEESFRSRFLGAMRNSRIKKEQAENFYSMFMDQRKLGPAANWSEFVTAFRKALNPSHFSRFIEFWKAGLLGIPTQVVNVSTTGGFLALRNLEQAVSIPASIAFSNMRGRSQERFISEAAARMKSTRMGLREAWDGLKMDIGDIAGLRPTDPGRRLEMGSFYDEPNLRQLFGAIGGKTGEFVRIPFKALDAFDNFWKHIIRNQEWAARANRMAHDAERRSPGESVSHASDRIYDELRRLSSDPFSHFDLWKKPGYRQTIEAGRDAAINDTFQEALVGPAMRKAVGNFREGIQAHPALELLVPFWKTPYNIVAEAMKRTPLAVAWTLNKYRKGELDDPAFVEAMVKSGMGTIFMLSAAGLALQGGITGGGPADPKQAQLLKNTGWQPRSFKIGDQYISYQRFAPFSILLGMAADVAEAWQRKDIDTGAELVQKGVASLTDNIMDQTFITGLSALTKIMTDPTRAGMSAIRGLEASLIPNVVGIVPVGHLARAIDPLYRETQAFTLSPLQAQIPGLSKLLPPQLEPTGEPRARKGTPVERLLSPFMRSTVQTGPVADAAEEIVRLGKSLEPTPRFFRVGEERVYYTEAEREQIANAVTKGVREVASLIRRSSYRALPDSESPDRPGARTKYDAILSVLNRYRQPVTARARRAAERRWRSE